MSLLSWNLKEDKDGIALYHQASYSTPLSLMERKDYSHAVSVCASVESLYVISVL